MGHGELENASFTIVPRNLLYAETLAAELNLVQDLEKEGDSLQMQPHNWYLWRTWERRFSRGPPASRVALLLSVACFLWFIVGIRM